MKTKRSLSLLLIVVSTFSFSQSNKLNQLDTKSKKDGTWVVYLDKNWKEVKDSASAEYFRYTFYDHGANIYPMGECGGKNYKLESKTNTSQENQKLKLLDGEYKWFDEKGHLRSIHILKKGEYISCKEFFPTGELEQHFDYTHKWEEQAHTWVLYIYDKKGNLKLESYMKKDEKGNWPITR